MHPPCNDLQFPKLNTTSCTIRGDANLLPTRILPRRWAQLVIKTVLRFRRDRCLEMGAALSYYAFFSLFPILLTSVSIIGFLLGPDSDASAQILSLSHSSLPPKALQG